MWKPKCFHPSAGQYTSDAIHISILIFLVATCPKKYNEIGKITFMLYFIQLNKLLSFQHAISTKILMSYFTFFSQVFTTQCPDLVWISHINSHTWPVATVLDS